VACGELFAASRDVLGVENAGSARRDCFLEEALVQNFHCPVHRRCKHVGGGHRCVVEFVLLLVATFARAG